MPTKQTREDVATTLAKFLDNNRLADPRRQSTPVRRSLGSATYYGLPIVSSRLEEIGEVRIFSTQIIQIFNSLENDATRQLSTFQNIKHALDYIERAYIKNDLESAAEVPKITNAA